MQRLMLNDLVIRQVGKTCTFNLKKKFKLFLADGSGNNM